MKGKSIIEVLVVFVLLHVFGWAFFSTELATVETRILGWSYVAGVIGILVPIAILLLTRRSFESYGLTLKGWKYNLDVGMTCYLVLLIPYGLLIGLLLIFHTSYMEMPGAAVLAAGEILALYLILSILRRRERASRATLARPHAATLNLFILITLLFLPIFVGFYLDRLTLKVASTVIWQFVFSGFGEELLFRGYYQSRINQEFGRPYNFLGVNFGIGLIIASLLFALAHILNPFNPFTGSLDLAWSWGLWAFFSGLFFGFVREKTESIIAVGIAHGLPDAVGESFGLMFHLMP